MESLRLQNLLVRADASARMGTGHVMRCLALAQAWQEQGGKALFAAVDLPPALERRLEAEGMDVVRLDVSPGSDEDAARTMALAQKSRAVWVVVDGYHFGADYQQVLKRAGLWLLFIDDYGHAGHYYADLVLNQNIHADESLYRHREPYTRLLLGTDYVLLRREFWPWRGWRREIPEVARKVLVTLGGGDPDNQTLKVIRALQRVEVAGLEAVVVVGGSNPHYAELEDAIRHSPFAIRLVRNVTNMPELMAWADVAISAGGSTCWELAFFGLPNVLLTLADNQRGIAEMLSKVGVGLNLGWYEDVVNGQVAQALLRLVNDREQRQRMSRAGRDLIDGQGSERVVSMLNER